MRGKNVRFCEMSFPTSSFALESLNSFDCLGNMHSSLTIRKGMKGELNNKRKD